jgi:hypothetical protein
LSFPSVSPSITQICKSLLPFRCGYRRRLPIDISGHSHFGIQVIDDNGLLKLEYVILPLESIWSVADICIVRCAGWIARSTDIGRDRDFYEEEMAKVKEG